jgi:hypothetical protein
MHKQGKSRKHRRVPQTHHTPGHDHPHPTHMCGSMASAARASTACGRLALFTQSYSIKDQAQSLRSSKWPQQPLVTTAFAYAWWR